MKVFQGNRFTVRGFNSIPSSNLPIGWIIQEKMRTRTYSPQTIIIDQCILINDGTLLYLHKDGSTETKVIDTQPFYRYNVNV